MVDFAENAQGQATQPEITNGERNKLSNSDRAFHDWYRFVLSYPPHLVRQYLDEFNLGKKDIVLDPFCGTGTTVVESKLKKFVSVGIEANRFAQFAGSVKIDWSVNAEDLLEHAKGVRDRAIFTLAKQGISDDPKKHVNIPNDLRTLSEEQHRIILKDSISPIPLHKSLVLLNEIDRFKITSFSNHFRLAFANALVHRISNLRFGPEVGIGKERTDVSVVGQWFDEIEKISSDIASIDANDYPEASVILSDSRDASKLLGSRKVSAIITSPPYPNEKDYTRTTRLESVMLGFITNKQELRLMKKSMLRSNTRGVYKDDDDDKFVKDIAEIQAIAKEIEVRRIELNKTSGFERMYARVTKLYFG
ncbi:MAG: DNA methyltransferase, partial [Blastocatellia bacterium]